MGLLASGCSRPSYSVAAVASPCGLGNADCVALDCELSNTGGKAMTLAVYGQIWVADDSHFLPTRERNTLEPGESWTAHFQLKPSSVTVGSTSSARMHKPDCSTADYAACLQLDGQAIVAECFAIVPVDPS